MTKIISCHNSVLKRKLCHHEHTSSTKPCRDVISQLIPDTLWASTGLSILGLIINSPSQRLRPGLRNIPGPFFASITDLWRLLVVERGRFELALQALHDRHGDLVRVGPNCVSVGDPRKIRQIYGIARLFEKV